MLWCWQTTCGLFLPMLESRPGRRRMSPGLAGRGRDARGHHLPAPHLDYLGLQHGQFGSQWRSLDLLVLGTGTAFLDAFQPFLNVLDLLGQLAQLGRSIPATLSGAGRATDGADAGMVVMNGLSAASSIS